MCGPSHPRSWKGRSHPGAARPRSLQTTRPRRREAPRYSGSSCHKRKYHRCTASRRERDRGQLFSAELAAKRLEFLRGLVPTAKRVAVLLNPAEPTVAAANLRDVEGAASAMAVQIRVFNASTIAEIDTAFAALASEQPDALFISGGPFFVNRRVQIAHLATRYAVPAIASLRAYPEAGGLMSYGTSQIDAHHQVGVYVGRILKGAKPADLPVVQSTKFELVINASTARRLGLTVPQTLLVAADEMIE